MSVLKKSIRGIRDRLPQGYILGRKSAGIGDVEAISFSDIAQQLARTPGGASTTNAAMSYGLASARPVSPGVPAGQLAFYYATDTSTLTVWNGSTWTTVGGGGGGLWGGLVNTPSPTKTNTGFSTWLNQGNAGETDVTGIGMAFSQTITNGATDHVRALTKSAPATPYTATGLLLLGNNILQHQTGTGNILVGWYDGSAKCHTLGMVPTSTAQVIREEKWTNPDTFNSQTIVYPATFLQILWFQLKDDGTNISAYVSADGGNWLPIIASIAKSSAWNGSSGYGKLLIGMDAADVSCNFVLGSYKETSP